MTARLERVVVVCLALLGALTVRFDYAVGRATETGWMRAQERAERAQLLDTTDWCEQHVCPRLPGIGASLYIVIAALFALGLVLVMLLFLERRLPREPVAATSAAKRARAAVRVLAVLCGLVGLVATLCRARYGLGAGYLRPVIPWLSALQLLLFGLALLIAARIGVSTIVPQHSLPARLGAFARRQRGQVLLAAGFFAFVLVFPTTSGQALDALRLADVSTAAGAAAAAFSVGTAVLLAIVIYECALRLESAPATSTTSVSARTWCAIGGAALLIGLTGRLLWVLGDGLIVFGALLLALAAASLVPGEPAGENAPSPTSAPRHWAEYLAVVPLLVLAVAAITASFDVLALEHHGAAGLASLIVVALLLIAAAVVMVDRRSTVVTVTSPEWRAWAWSFGTFVALSVVLVLLVRGSKVAVGAGVALAAASLVYAWHVFVGFGAERTALQRRNHGWSLPVAVAAGVAALITIHLDPFGVAPIVGTIAMVNLAASVVVVTLYGLAIMSSRITAPGLLQLFGVRRLPVLFLVGAWWVLAGSLAPGDMHDVRLEAHPTAALAPTAVQPTLDVAFAEWLRAQPEFSTPAARGTKATSVRPVPLVLVSSHGGGIRAAYWTALVLDCIVGTSPVDTAQSVGPLDSSRNRTCADRRRTAADARRAAARIFLASGVSGGAVGLGAYAAQQLQGGVPQKNWIDDRLGRDLLAPTVGWGLFHDLPNHLIGLSPRRGGRCALKVRQHCWSVDRAAILEDAIDPRSPPLRGTWDARLSQDEDTRSLAEAVPLLVTNATSVSGGRAVVSPAELADWPESEGWDPDHPQPMGQVAEGVDMLCAGYDLRISTATVLGARFPLVSPSGRMAGNCQITPGDSIPKVDYSTPCATGDTFCATQMVDGGYVDNSGLLTIEDLWPRLVRLVRAQNRRTAFTPIAIVIVDIDSHYEDELAFRSPNGPAGESVAPAKALLGGRAAIEEQARSFAFHARPSTCFVTIAPQSHPGLTAPLGWALSKATRLELVDSLTRPAPAAIGGSGGWPIYRLRRLQQWLEPGSPQPKLFTPPLRDCVPTG